MSVPDGRQHVAVVIRGRVQGVGFRWFVQRTASRLGLDGWVANRRDGAVEVVAEGPVGPLERLLDALNEGPAGAQVTTVEVHRGPPTGMSGGFGIRSGEHPGD